MQLTNFLTTLFTEGKVTVNGTITGFPEEDRAAAVALLERIHAEDTLEMPLEAPAFDPGAALVTAEYLYFAVQLIVVRDLDQAAIQNRLPPLPEPASADIIYSADLTMRYLPQLFHLAKGLSPMDILVTKLKETATRWPFSSVGIELETEYELENILAHPSLKYAYADRILAEKDKLRAKHPAAIELMAEVLGGYAKEVWPELG